MEQMCTQKQNCDTEIYNSAVVNTDSVCKTERYIATDSPWFKYENKIHPGDAAAESDTGVFLAHFRETQNPLPFKC